MTAPTVRVVNHPDSAGIQAPKGPQSDRFEEVAVSSPPDGLKPIPFENFHVLFAQPLLLRNSPAQDDTLPADLASTDEINRKSVALASRKQRIHNNLDAPNTRRRMKPESVASILVRELELAIHNWIDLVEEATKLTCIPMSPDKWSGHLPEPLTNPILRWKVAPPATRLVPIAAHKHGEVCREQGCTAAMLEETLRKLQASALSTRRKDLRTVHLGSMAPSMMAIADEEDSLRINRRRFTMRL